jgi:hypothetical protein
MLLPSPPRGRGDDPGDWLPAGCVRDRRGCSGWSSPRNDAPAVAGSAPGRCRRPASAWRNCDARRQHTAHQFHRARICYRHHPFFDQEVEVVRSLRRQFAPSVIIKTDDGLQLAVLAWMLDAVYCASLRDEATPTISIHALCALRELIDRHSWSAETPHDSSCSSPREGGCDEQECSPSDDPPSQPTLRGR